MSILKELEKKLPSDASITEVKFEGSEIVLYTKNKDFFNNSESTVRSIVKELKKRVEIRPDVSISIDPEKAKKEIEKIVPEDAGIKAIYFEPELGKVVIESQKPGLVIGKGGETFRKIKEKTLWLPKIERAPVINSDIVRAVRNLLHSEIDYRKKFLNRIGMKINDKIEVDKSKEWIRLSTLGGFRQVGRSCLLIQTNNSSVMLDCGVDVSCDAAPLLEAPEFDIEKLDAIILSHAHLDHCGHIPWLYDKGYAGPLYCTPPTRDLAGEVSDIATDMRLTFQPSAHLLGSALTHLHVGEGLHNILYTGDLKYAPSRLFDPASTDFKRVETLIIESTYGAAKDRFENRRDIDARFMETIDRVMKRGGKVLIPSFAVGRGQEIMAILAQNNFKYPIYLEGMIWDATAIHTAYPEYLSRNMQRDIFHRGKNPLTSEAFKKVAPKERNDIIDDGKPGVIIATSGMLIGGPAVEYLKALAHDKKNMIMFVGYQAEGTPGRRIQKGWREVPIYGDGKTKTLKLELEIETTSGLSGHADRRELMSFIHRLPSRPERIITGHGENAKCLELARDAHKNFRSETIAPKNLEAIRLK